MIFLTTAGCCCQHAACDGACSQRRGGNVRGPRRLSRSKYVELTPFPTGSERTNGMSFAGKPIRVCIIFVLAMALAHASWVDQPAWHGDWVRLDSPLNAVADTARSQDSTSLVRWNAERPTSAALFLAEKQWPCALGIEATRARFLTLAMQYRPTGRCGRPSFRSFEHWKRAPRDWPRPSMLREQR